MEVSFKWLAIWCSVLAIGIHANEGLDLLSESLNIETASCDNTINRCQNGGRCISVGSQKFCKCRKGSSGPLCETVDDCKDNICGKSTGTDVFCMYDQIRESAVCICKQNYYGFDRVEGECRPTCFVDQDCSNGALCLQKGINEKENFTVGPNDQKFCRCLPGTSGKECETVLSCDQDKEFCGKGAAKDVCYYDARDQRAKCTCPVSGEVFDHSIKTCRECDCGKQSVSCSFLDGEKQCCCKTGFYDVNGSCKDCECGDQGVACMLQNGKKVCTCKDGFYFVNGICNECKCGKNSMGCFDKDGNKVCKCKDGFKQNGATCDVCDCGSNSIDCDFVNGKTNCTCEHGYVPKEGMCTVACGTENPCKNGGNCPGGKCECKPGTDGDFCELVPACDKNICPEDEGITCVYDQDKEKAVCKCPIDTQAYVAGEKKCKEQCDDDNLVCENQGTCVSTAEGRFCECLKGTSGELCQKIDKCDTTEEVQELCGNDTGVLCVYDASRRRPMCDCKDGDKQFNDATKTCMKTCNDKDRSCENGGSCVDKTEGEFCECLNGTSGDLCHVVDQCHTWWDVRSLCGEHSGSSCNYSVVEQKAYCLCLPEGQIYDKETKKCRIPCDDNEHSCKNGGTCPKVQNGMSFCQCKDGTFGDQCEKITKCDVWHEYVHFCGGGANVNCSFNASTGEPFCFCDSPNQKFNSKTKKCTITCDESTTLCVNEGECVSTGEGKFCQCEEGFSGDLCEVVDACIASDVVPSYCGDDKSVECILDDALGHIVCICRGEKGFDYRLKQCRDTCDEVDKLCKNGRCVFNSSYDNNFCRCNKGFSGDFCEHVDECDTKCGKGNDVTCEYNDKGENVNCVCKDGLKRFDKVEKKCRAPCENDKDCKNSAKCSRIDGIGFCRCSLGITSGDFCEFVDDCEDRKVDCGVGNGAICVFAAEQKTGRCKCENEKKQYDEKTKRCINCDCGSLSYGCMLTDGSPWCQCDDGAYNKDHYCYDCNCGDYSDGCNYDQVLKEKTCQCHAGFSQNRDRCEACDCGPNSRDCKFTNGEINCTCEKGFIQKDGYCVPACNETQPCAHEGKCLGGYCQCKKGTGGTLCNIITACSNIEICGRDEKVLCLYDEEREEAYCKCNGTGLMFDYDSKKCVECNCGDKGVCSLENGKKKCDCIPTFGSLNGKCEECKCGDKAISCTTTKDGKVQCLCEKDFDLKQGTCTKCGCGENSEGCTFEKDKITCKCKKGFSQRGTKCEVCDCGDNGTCSLDNSGKKTCVCKSGYALKNGKCVGLCSDNCKNGGSCKKEAGGNFCSCLPGTSGDLCEVVEDCVTAYKDCKDDFGTCKYKVEDKKAYCECKEKTQYNSDLKRCRKICSREVPCKNSGTCEDAVCKCAEGTSGDLCSIVDGCKDLESVCNAGQGVCIYAPDKPGKAACGCEDEGFVFSEKDGNCSPIWCLENSCAATARCEFDGSLKVAFCKCDDKTAYYNHTGKSCNAVDSCIFKPKCKKFEVCQNGECKCPEYHKQTNVGCKPDLCSLHKCAYFKDATCKETDLLETVNCVCGSGLFYDGSQCSDGNCFLPGRWSSCNNGCPYGMEQTDTGCQAIGKDKICSKSCGKYGFCVKEGGKEQCRCLPKFSELMNGFCILNATAVCASKRLTKDSTKCECTGILKYAKDGITCEKRSCTDLDVQEECKRVGAVQCENNWEKPGMDSGAGYECVCRPGYSKDEYNICTEKCKLKNHISKCAARGQICVMDHLYNAVCKCPPTTSWNETTQRCDILNENVFMMQNLPVIRKKYITEDGTLDKVMLNVDIVNAMVTVYPKKILDYAFLLNYSESSDIIKCNVIVQFHGPTKYDAKRYTFYADLQLNCKDCSMYLMPPVLLDKKSFNDITLQSLDFCSEPLRNYLCGPGSGCKDRACSCNKGYRIAETSVQVADDFSLFRCEDIDECLEKTDECTKNTTCVNIPGSYFCNCKQGFKKLSDTVPYKNAQDKEGCVDFCSPSPCKKGACRLKEKGFDCSCDVGYSGSLCDAADEHLKKANTNSKVIGGVLGTLLTVMVIACLAFYYLQFYRKRTRNNSDGALIPTRMQADATELAERSIEISNPLTE